MTSTRYSFLVEPDRIRGYVQTLRSQPTLAIDLEADSLYSYPEKVCLVQISTRSANTILDALTGGDASRALGTVLGDAAICKVFHGGDYDIRLLKKHYGFEVRSIVDTMIGAQLAGRAKVGLADLLQEEFGIHLQKRYQRANWSHRPLSAEQLQYAALDTAWLLQLWRRIRQQLVSLGRLEWAEEEFRLLEAVVPSPERAPSCFDIKGYQQLSARELAILQALVELREETARAWNRPPFKVLSSGVLLRWAQSPPSNRRQVVQTPGAGRDLLRRLAPQIVAAIRRAKSLPEEEWPRREPSPYRPFTQEQKRRLRRLKTARSEASKRLDLDAGLLVNSKTLERLARADPKESRALLEESLKQWQLQVLGSAIRRTL